MCGIFGFHNFTSKKFTGNSTAFHKLMRESYSRGKEASGVALLDENNTLYCIKSDLDGKKLLKTPEYRNLLKTVSKKSITTAIGHSRIATHGTQLLQKNNQPVATTDKKIIAVHNGIIANADYLWELTGNESSPPELDTLSLTEYFGYLLLSHSREAALSKLFRDIEGSASIAMIMPHDSALVLATNTGSLYFLVDEEKQTAYFASEKLFLNKIISRKLFENQKIIHLKPQTAVVFENQTYNIIQCHTLSDIEPALKSVQSEEIKHIDFVDFSSGETQSKAKKLYTVTNSIDKLRSHDFNYEKIYALRRCTKCILPETTPFISFDSDGVCNFCHEHEPIKYKGKDALLQIVEKYRKANGEPDCLAAFSGGKDSSYGLNFLKKELGLQPLAYTYDWGMVTDIARRNQARVLGKLGVEHVVVSADITKKRKHIRQNILAWLKDPHPGMVTLFMQGDKQCEFYADRLMKKYNLDLMFFFRGNELEKEEFKTGHCGVKDADPGGVIHHLPVLKKAKLLSFYAGRYFRNPAYFNSSFFDTSLAFYSTYIQKHNYVFLWHYIPWHEKEILNSLTGNFNFELPGETIQTWRTDDGTSAFYNYIYYHIQGFTENDSFRSRQIREGLIDREAAMKIVNEENKPRYEALQWYFDVVGLDGDYVLGVVDKIKPLY